MKTLADIITEAQALATVSEDQFEAQLATLVSDLQALAAPAQSDPDVSIVVTTQSGATKTFVPQE